MKFSANASVRQKDSLWWYLAAHCIPLNQNSTVKLSILDKLLCS